MKLSDRRCEVCTSDSKAVLGAERDALMDQIHDWSILEVEGIPRLKRRFVFPSFKRALAFANRIGAMAEAEDHHPELVTEWGACTVSWWTHSIGGLHLNDFVMAAKSDQVYGQGHGK